MSADPDRIAEARRMLTALGVSPADLCARPPVPTLNEYLPRVVAAAGPGARKAYQPYWNRLVVAFGTQPLDRITATDIEELEYRVAAHLTHRCSNRGGRSAREQLLAAARAVYNRAIADDLLPSGSSPAHRIPKPRRLPSTRRALTADELDQINTVTRTCGNDPVLDALLLRLHTETACRRGGALALRVRDLDTYECLIRLREKGETVRWQPVSPELARALARHGAGRGAKSPGADLLRYRDGRPLTFRRYDNLWNRIRRDTPWLRHTPLTWVELNFGYGVARAYAGHTDSTSAATTTYHKSRYPCRRHRPGRDDRPTPPTGRSTRQTPIAPDSSSGRTLTAHASAISILRSRKPTTTVPPQPHAALHRWPPLDWGGCLRRGGEGQ